MADISATQTSARSGESRRDEWGTPDWLYALLDKEFDFDLDPAATDENALCEYYFTQEDNGLTQPWWGNVFVNPPYSQLKQWLKKGYEEARDGHAQVVMLVAARTDTKAWWEYARLGKVRFLQGRLRFKLSSIEQKLLDQENLVRLGAGLKPLAPSSAPFPSAVVVFEKYLAAPTTTYWKVRDSHVLRK